MANTALALDEFAAHLDTLDYSQKTRESFRDGLKNFHEHGFTEVTIENGLAYRDMLIAEGKKGNTVNARIHALNAYLRWKGLPVIKEIKVNEDPFSKDGMETDEYHRLLFCLLQDGQYRWYIAIKLLAGTGMRISEAVTITWGDLRRGMATVIGKGRKSRTIYFSDSLRETLFPYYHGKPDNERIIPWSETCVRENLRKVKEKYKIQGMMNPHEWRRFFAREMYSSTKDAALIKGLLGHGNLKTTYKYIKPTQRAAMQSYQRAQNW